MIKKYFQSYEPIDKSGLVNWTPFIEKQQVIEAYSHGVFPWPEEEESIFWFSPLKRGILQFDNVKWSRSDYKFFKNCNYEFKYNFNFENVIRTCAKVKIELEKGTWITNDLIETYLELHKMGLAQSFEVYDEGHLVGAVYGVYIHNYFSAESMFYIKPNASKYALMSLIEYFKKQRLSWIDTQVVTAFTSGIGAKEISRNEFLNLIK